jgi:hypothetical protein
VSQHDEPHLRSPSPPAARRPRSTAATAPR